MTAFVEEIQAGNLVVEFHLMTDIIFLMFLSICVQCVFLGMASSGWGKGRGFCLLIRRSATSRSESMWSGRRSCAPHCVTHASVCRFITLSRLFMSNVTETPMTFEVDVCSGRAPLGVDITADVREANIKLRPVKPRTISPDWMWRCLTDKYSHSYHVCVKIQKGWNQ